MSTSSGRNVTRELTLPDRSAQQRSTLTGRRPCEQMSYGGARWQFGADLAVLTGDIVKPIG